MIIIELLYLSTALLLAVYGCHNLLMTWLFVRGESRGGDGSINADACGDLLHYPTVTIQLPIYNERHVVERLIDAAVALDWPRDRLQIQVLDDSTDTTVDLVDRKVIDYRAVGLNIDHVRRPERVEFKAGALQYGLDHVIGEYVAIFDADFIPAPDFLKRTIPCFDEKGEIGCVQTRWGHANPDSSWLTRAQALGIDGHFIVEQVARSETGAYLNFNGTAGIWRTACIRQAGGWKADTLTEDLDISYRAQLAGWRILYEPGIVVPAELPVQINAFKSQQFRWAKGSFQTAIKLLGAVWRTRESLWRKGLATLHLTNYAVHPLLLLNLLLTLPISFSTRSFLFMAPLVFVSAIGPSVMYFVASRTMRMPLSHLLQRLAVMIAVGIGLSVSNTRAVLEAILGIQSDFKRTPKFAVRDRSANWIASEYVLPLDRLVWVEAFLGVYALFLVIWSIATGWVWMTFWMGLYVGGYAYMVGLAIIQQRQSAQTALSPL